MSDSDSSGLNWGSGLSALGKGLETVGKNSPSGSYSNPSDSNPSQAGLSGYTNFLSKVSNGITDLMNTNTAMNTAKNGDTPSTGLSSSMAGGDQSAPMAAVAAEG